MAETVLFLLGPLLATGLAGFLVHSSLRESRKYSKLTVAMGLTILAAICYWLFHVSSYGQIAPVAALVIGILCACVALVCGVWMIWTLKTWRKLAAVVVGVAFPLSMFYSILGGDAQSPENLTEGNGDLIVQALYKYRASAGRFPQSLAGLEPVFLVSQHEALTTQHTGWLYESTGDSFTLGYWYWPEKYGASVCLYRSSNMLWDCDFNNWGPFRLVPTPGSCRNDQGEWVDMADCK